MTRVQHIGLVYEHGKYFGQLFSVPTERRTITKSDVERHINEMTARLDAKQWHELSDLFCKKHDIYSTKPRTPKVEGCVKVTPDYSPKTNRIEFQYLSKMR